MQTWAQDRPECKPFVVKLATAIAKTLSLESTAFETKAQCMSILSCIVCDEWCCGAAASAASVAGWMPLCKAMILGDELSGKGEVAVDELSDLIGEGMAFLRWICETESALLLLLRMGASRLSNLL